MCKHVAALLYTVADSVAKGENKACTSRIQSWHQPSTKLQKTAYLVDIATPKASPSMVQPAKKLCSRRDQFDPRCSEHQRKRSLGEYNLDRLADISNGKAAALLYASMVRDEQPVSQLPDIRFPVHEVELTSSKIINVCTVAETINSGKSLAVTEDDRDWIVTITCKQSESELWYQHREGRITSSNVGKVLKHVNDDDRLVGATHSITATIMGYYKIDEQRLPKPLQWGRLNEAKALERYRQKQQHHKSLKVSKTGLWVSLHHPFLAASPDSLVDCQCCGAGVVEIKCPWTERNATITELIERQKSGFLEKVSENVTLRKSHDYYSQVQLQMYCTNRSYCDFVVYTAAGTDNLGIFRIPYDKQHVDEITRKATVFWHQVILSELGTRSVQQKLDLSQPKN